MGALRDLYAVGAFTKRGSKGGGENNAASMPGSTGDPDPIEDTKQRSSSGRDDSGETGAIGRIARFSKRAIPNRR